MNEALLKELVDGGLAEDKARDIATRHGIGDAPAADVDGLRKALEVVSQQQTQEADQFKMDFDALKGNAEAVTDALCKSADALLQEHRSQNAVISTAMLRILDLLGVLDERQGSVDENLKKAIDLQNGQPLPRLSQQGLFDAVPRGGAAEAATGWLPSNFVPVAEAAYVAARGDHGRQDALRKAISMANSGQRVDLDGFAKALNLTLPAE